jgi:hypothetical protein
MVGLQIRQDLLKMVLIMERLETDRVESRSPSDMAWSNGAISRAPMTIPRSSCGMPGRRR